MFIILRGNVFMLAIENQEMTTTLKTSKRRKTEGNYSCGSLITRIAQIIRDFIQESIAEKVKLVGTFSVEMDTTQDVTTQDQCSIVLRYVHDGHVSERLN